MQLLARKGTNEIWNIAPTNRSVHLLVMVATRNMERAELGLTRLPLLQPISLINNQALIQTLRGILPGSLCALKWCISYRTASNFLLVELYKQHLLDSQCSFCFTGKSDMQLFLGTNQVLLVQKKILITLFGLQWRNMDLCLAGLDCFWHVRWPCIFFGSPIISASTLGARLPWREQLVLLCKHPLLIWSCFHVSRKVIVLSDV